MDKKGKISMAIEGIVRDNPDTTFLEAILVYATEYDIPVDTMPKYISNSLKEKLKAECRNKNLLKVSPVVSLPDEFFE